MTISTMASVDKSSDRVRLMFAQIAGKYDLLNHLLSLNIDKSWRTATVRHVGPVQSGPILDLCTGTGDLAFAFRQTNPQVEIVGADFCTEMLDVAKDKLAQRSVREIDFVEASAMQLPFPQGHFEVVSVAFGIRNVEDTDQGLREIVRVCRPGGQVAILEFSKPSIWPLNHLYPTFDFYFPALGNCWRRTTNPPTSIYPAVCAPFPLARNLLSGWSPRGWKTSGSSP